MKSLAFSVKDLGILRLPDTACEKLLKLFIVFLIESRQADDSGLSLGKL